MLVTWCHKIHRLPPWSTGPNCLCYAIVLDTQCSATVVLSGPAFVASRKYTFDPDFGVAWRRAAYRSVTIAEARCAPKFILKIQIEIARLATATN